MLTFHLSSLSDTIIKDFTKFEGAVNGSVVIGLNDGRSASVTVSLEDPVAPAVRALSTVLNVGWEQGRLFKGVVLRPQFQGTQRQLVIPARDPSIRLKSFQIGSDPAGNSLAHANSGDFGYLGVDQSIILSDLFMEYPYLASIGEGAPHPGINTGLLPAVSHLRDRDYQPGKTIWEAGIELTNIIDGIDFDLNPSNPGNGFMVTLDTYYPQMGTDRSSDVVFEFGHGMENCTQCDIEEAGDLVRNRSTRLGKLDEITQIQPSYDTENIGSLGQYGFYSEYVGESDVVDVHTLQDHALAVTQTFGYPPFFVSVTPAQQDGSGYQVNSSTSITPLPHRYGAPPVIGPQGDYWLGDTVGVIAKYTSQLQFDLKARVTEITLSRVSSGATVTQLKLSPERGGGYLIPGVVKPTFVREFASMREQTRLQGVVQ